MMLPVTIPAPIVNPPRTSGLSTARVNTRSAAIGSGECVLMPARARRSLRALGHGLLYRRQRGRVVRVRSQFRDVLYVANHVVPVYDENCAAEDTQFLNQRPIIGAEGTVAMVR